MAIVEFHPQLDEKILYRTSPSHKWYVFVWKIGSGMVGIIILTVVLYALLAGPTENALLSILPVWAAHLLANLLYFGLLPLAALAWLAENMASVLIGEFILTNQRIWIRGSPYAWSQGETQLDDIASLTWRRDAVFIRQKSTRNLQVHMFSDGKLFVKAYEQFIGK